MGREGSPTGSCAQCCATAPSRPGKGTSQCSIISLYATRVLRSPKSISGEGCSHSVKISQRSLPDALRILQRVGLSPKRIYITAGNGSYQEVEL